MNRNERVRMTMREQAGEWFVANRHGRLDPAQCGTFAAWLRTSPVHVEEYLGVALIARDLPRAAAEPDVSLEVLLARARSANDAVVRPLGARIPGSSYETPRIRWAFGAAVAMALAAAALAFLWWSGGHAPTVRYAT